MQLTMSLTSCQLTAASRLMTMFQHSSSRAAKSTSRREENAQDLAQDDLQYNVLSEGRRAGSKALGAEVLHSHHHLFEADVAAGWAREHYEGRSEVCVDFKRPH